MHYSRTSTANKPTAVQLPRLHHAVGGLTSSPCGSSLLRTSTPSTCMTASCCSSSSSSSCWDSGTESAVGALCGSRGIRSKTLHTQNDKETSTNRQQADSAHKLTHGMGVFCTMCLVSSLNFLQNSIMLMPRGPRAWPIAGPGLAVPAGTRILTVRTNDMLSWRPFYFVLCF